MTLHCTNRFLLARTATVLRQCFSAKAAKQPSTFRSLCFTRHRKRHELRFAQRGTNENISLHIEWLYVIMWLLWWCSSDKCICSFLLGDVLKIGPNTWNWYNLYTVYIYIYMWLWYFMYRTAMTWRKPCPSFLWIRLILHHAAPLSNRKRDFF